MAPASHDESPLDQILTGIGQPFYVLDRNWRFTHFNNEAERYFGRPATEMLGRRLWEVFPNEAEHERGRILRAAMATRRPVQGEAQSMIGRRLVMYSIFPLGEGIGVVFYDVSARRDAEEAVRERTTVLEAVLETIPTAVWFTTDPEANYVVRNRRASEILRLPPAGATPQAVMPHQTFRFQRDGQDVAPDALPLRRAARGEFVDAEVLELMHKTGERRILLVRAAPLVGSGGKVAGAVCAAADVTERHDYEARLRLLLNESMHRVKNTLAIVQSIATLTLKDVDAEPREAFLQRLHSLARMHSLMADSNWTVAELGAVLRASLASILVSERVSIEGPTLNLQSRTAVAIALAAHELATNALKYGSLSTAVGRVAIRWSTEGGRFYLTWQESGGPPVAARPTRKGFGTKLIQALGAEIHGLVALDYRYGGLICTVEAPISKVIADITTPS